jgi:hypothetical protein
VTEKLHDLLPFAGEFCPTRIRFRVLFQPSQRLALELEISFAQLGSAGPPHWIASAPELNGWGVLDQSLPPHRNQGVF